VWCSHRLEEPLRRLLLLCVRARLHRRAKPLGNHFCCCVACLRSSASPWGAIGKPLLLVFAEFACMCVALGSYWESIFACAHSHRGGEPLGNYCSCYLRCSPPFASPFEAVDAPYLLLCVKFAIICIALGSHWDAIFDATCNIGAHSRRLGKSWGTHFC
jgi:hypothetical protein